MLEKGFSRIVLLSSKCLLVCVCEVFEEFSNEVADDSSDVVVLLL